MGIIESVPAFLTAGVLAVILVYLRGLSRDPRLQLWAVGWALVLAHFLAQLLGPVGQPHSLSLAINAGSLQAGAIAFLVSVLPVEDRAQRIRLILTLAVPSLAYVTLSSYHVVAVWPYLVCLAACFGGAALSSYWPSVRPSPHQAIAMLLCVAVGVWAVCATLRGSFDEGTAALLGMAFALAGVFCFRNCRRPSPTVIAVSGGFLCWGAISPLKLLLKSAAPHIVLPAKLWNAPKIIVALGMVLIIVEEKSASIAALQGKARHLNRQLERFSAITSRLLSCARIDSMCDDIAFAITEVTSFRVAVIQIENADHSWHVAGSNGLSEERLALLQSQVQQWTSEAIHEVCSRSRRIAPNTLLLSEPYAACESDGSGPNPCDHWIMPLRSATGTCLGCITLTDPEDATAVNPDELSRIEALAANMAVALELKSLKMQLVQSDKLAAVGQLVAGVAHELNNPLTAVMGYGELVADEVSTPRAHDHLIKLADEARRMKKIVDNLLKFSRQSRVRKPTTRLADVVHDVLALREYDLRIRGIKATVDFETQLSTLAIDEDKVRQILLNLLNNSIDAMETSLGSKQFKIRACQTGNRTVIVVEDTGTGFRDLQRALDPFYTTKPAGKGTGLGLSISYGIVRENGGDVRLENVKPHGARVTIELPIAETVPLAPALAFAVGTPA